MAHEIKIPRLGWNMEEGSFVEWLRRDLERIEAGQPLFAIEGDKAVAEIEAIESGILRIPAEGPKGGETVKVGQIIGYLAQTADEELPALNSAPRPPEVQPSARTELPMRDFDDAFYPSGVEAPRPVEMAIAAEARTISPRAARLAAALGVDWRHVRGTGKTGRVRERDIQNAYNRPPG